MIFDRFQQVGAFVFAFHGVCTDGRVAIPLAGEPGYVFHVRDLYALRIAARHYPAALVSNGPVPESVRAMIGRVGLDLPVFSGWDDPALQAWFTANRIEESRVLCMGSNDADLPMAGMSVFGTCPADAVEEVKAAATYISPCNGGAGAVRDVVEKVMKLHGVWDSQHIANRP